MQLQVGKVDKMLCVIIWLTESYNSRCTYAVVIYKGYDHSIENYIKLSIIFDFSSLSMHNCCLLNMNIYYAQTLKINDSYLLATYVNFLSAAAAASTSTSVTH